MFVCLLVCQILSNFRSGASLKGFVFEVFFRKFFLCSNGNNFSFNGKAQDKVYGYSVSLSVVFLHLAYSERFISWEYSLSWISSGGNFENTHLISLSGYPVWLVVPTKDSPIYNMVCMMFLFKIERTFPCKEYHTWSSLYEI